jgi:CCR4-NOT transcription complex subunit 1
LSEQQGIDTYLHFIRRLIVQCQPRLVGAGGPLGVNAHDQSAHLTFRLLAQETARLARDPFLADRLRDALDRGEGEVFRTFDLGRFVQRVELRPLERLVVASALIRAGRKELASQAFALVRAEFDGAILGLCQAQPFDGQDLALAGAGKLIGNLLTDVPGGQPLLDSGQRQTLVLAAQTKYGTEAVAPVLARVFPHLTLPPGAALVPTLAQMGPEITGQLDVVLAVLLRFGLSDVTPPSDAAVVDIVGALARLAPEGALACDVGAVIRALAHLNPGLPWPALVRTLDQPERVIVDTASLKLALAALVACPRDADPHAVRGLWTPWDNALYQLRVLDALLSLPPETFSFLSLPGRRIVTVEDVNGASPTIKAIAAVVQTHSWNSLDLFDVLVRAAGAPAPDVRQAVKDMLDKAVKISPELVHMGLLQAAPGPWSDLRADYAQRLLDMFLQGHPNHQLVFMRIWQVQPSYLTNAFRDFYGKNPMHITRILDVAQDLKILDALLDVRPFTFGLDVASLASRREYLNLEKWLQDNVERHGAEFVRSVIDFLEIKMDSEKAARLHDPPIESPTLSLTPAQVTLFMRLLGAHMDLVPSADADYCVEVRTQCLQIYPRLMSLVPGSGADPGVNVVTYPAEIEAEVDTIYKQMYDGAITLDVVLQMLQRRKAAAAPRDLEIFSCMLHFLFDEYRFFGTYPAPELTLTSRLFGQVVQLGLVENIPLGIAIRYVCDALACAPDTALFSFGIQALSQFDKRLPEFPTVCQRLARLPHVLEFWPELAHTLRRALAGADITAAVAARAGEAFTAIRPDADALAEEVEAPPEELSDRILFVINNLAPSNFEQKLADMRAHYDDRHARWLARYLVEQRVSTEPNNHALYLRFLDALDRRPLFAHVLAETLAKAAALLNAEATLASPAERAVLKNIGVWLGTLTLARDRPIRHRHLAFKELLLEAADNSRLPLAIPFVCKTLEPAAKSAVFRPPNPWLMAVLGLLAELYHFAELKLNLKFEIEVLCKSLDVMLDALEPATLFRNRPAAGVGGVGIGADGLPDFADLGPLPSEFDPGALGGGGVGPAPTSPGESQRAIDAHIEGILAQLAQTVVISREFDPSGTNTAFKRAVQVAVDRAVREIVVPVVERSVTIAGISTRELASKDFATEPSEDKLRKAAQLMSQKLAGSLALVTCKEPLRSNLNTHVRAALIEHGFPEVGVHLVVRGRWLTCAAAEYPGARRRADRERQHRGRVRGDRESRDGARDHGRRREPRDVVRRAPAIPRAAPGPPVLGPVGHADKLAVGAPGPAPAQGDWTAAAPAAAVRGLW